MSQADSFDNLMERLRAGDPDAATIVFNRFAERLIGLARSRLDRRLRQKVDPEDVLQSVYKSFFLRQAQGRFDIHSWDGLWGLLTVITLRKCGQWSDRFQTQRRNLGAEVAPGGPDQSGAAWEAIARDPTPSEAVVLAETVERLLTGLEERDRDIVALALQGHTAPEISAQLGRPERTVYRILQRIKKRLERMRDEGEESA